MFSLSIQNVIYHIATFIINLMFCLSIQNVRHIDLNVQGVAYIVCEFSGDGSIQQRETIEL